MEVLLHWIFLAQDICLYTYDQKINGYRNVGEITTLGWIKRRKINKEHSYLLKRYVTCFQLENYIFQSGIMYIYAQMMQINICKLFASGHD